MNASGWSGPCSCATLRAFAPTRTASDAELAFIEHEQRFIGNGQRQHLFTLGAGGFRLRAVRRNVVWDDNDFAKANLIRQNLDRFEVTIMHRIEGAAVHCLQLSHINHQ
jgi:hypothetical protein